MRIDQSASPVRGPTTCGARRCSANKKTMATEWDSIVAWLKEDPAIKIWLADLETVTDLTTFDDQKLKDWQIVLSYTGFDVKKIIKGLITAHKAWTDRSGASSVDFDITAKNEDGTDKIIKYSSKSILSTDIRFIVTLFAIRGCCWEKILLKSNPDAIAILNHLKEKLNIDITTRPPGTVIEGDVITVPRIAACFPTMVADVFHNGAAKLLVSPEKVGIPVGLSLALVCPQYPAIIPKDWLGNPSPSNPVAANPHILFFLIQVEIDNLLHKNDGKITDLVDMLQYYKAAYESPATPLASRHIYNSKVGAANAAVNGYNPALTPAFVGARDLIKISRPDDPNIGTVIHQLECLK